MITTTTITTTRTVVISIVSYLAGRASLSSDSKVTRKNKNVLMSRSATFLRTVHECAKMGFSNVHAAGSKSELTEAEAVAAAIMGSGYINFSADLKDKPASNFLSAADIQDLAKKSPSEDDQEHQKRLKYVASKARTFNANFPAATDVLATTMTDATKRNETAPKV